MSFKKIVVLTVCLLIIPSAFAWGFHSSHRRGFHSSPARSISYRSTAPSRPSYSPSKSHPTSRPKTQNHPASAVKSPHEPAQTHSNVLPFLGAYWLGTAHTNSAHPAAHPVECKPNDKECLEKQKNQHELQKTTR